MDAEPSWEQRYPALTLTAIPGRTPAQVARILGWSEWKVVAVSDLPAIEAGEIKSPEGGDPAILHARPGGTLVWEIESINIALSGTLHTIARDDDIVASLIYTESTGTEFAVADAAGLIVSAASLTFGVVAGRDPHRYEDKYEEFDLDVKDLDIGPVLNLMEFVTGIEICPPHLDSTIDTVFLGSVNKDISGASLHSHPRDLHDLGPIESIQSQGFLP